MDSDARQRLRAELVAAIEQCRLSRRSPGEDIQAAARAYARAGREAGLPVERVLVEVKTLTAAAAGAYDDVFVPRVVGWTVAGYFARASGEAGEER